MNSSILSLLKVAEAITHHLTDLNETVNSVQVKYWNGTPRVTIHSNLINFSRVRLITVTKPDPNTFKLTIPLRLAPLAKHTTSFKPLPYIDFVRHIPIMILPQEAPSEP